MERSILPAMWQIPDVIRKRVGNKPGRQRAMTAEQHVLLVLHRPPQPDEKERDGRFFWRKPDGTWSSSDHGAGPNSLSKLLEEYAEQIERYDQLEEAAHTAPEYFGIINGLSPLLRAARHVHQTLDEARKLAPDDRELLNLRDRSYEIERTAELLFNDAKNSLEYLNTFRAEQQAETSHRMETAAHRLNLLAAFFLPLATISSILEVNPETAWLHLQQPQTFVVVGGVGLIAGMILTWLVGGRAAPRTAQTLVKPKPAPVSGKRRG